ncbi:single-stranded-DNA-specific exonuclease RecJ [Synechococcus sp. CS-1324]|uniref:single-stranded-DNA-specific exonuclease RecJ n=1 Tax=Synechococcus sp. CS-1324 TaxID=2847980 RepID=UPI000DB0C05D|nr:single-stranded-DNA-specific exonuclease RecJ [Synechococcus sp. CS-1324]PZV02886.1 MAG: single-stranded-DNA-specific exonuclease RecJ [Cyanobium sp.]
MGRNSPECSDSGENLVLNRLPDQCWQLPRPLDAVGAGAEALALSRLGLPPELLAVLRRRGYESAEAIDALLVPAAAPDPGTHFNDLGKAVDRLRRACRSAEAVAICGDYDADGMTSTALLMGVLQRLGARPVAAIPSRQDDGYGLNPAMVKRLAGDGISLLVTVDNGIAATEALACARELQVEVILTDHHTLPPEEPPYLALLHPARTPADSPFRGLAGVGLAYVLAVALAGSFDRADATAMALDLFCIGTIADMAPLLGVNRRWLQDGLPRLHGSSLPGLQALQRLAGVGDTPLDATAVAFQLAPRINAVGRLGDPQLVVELLTTDDRDRAMELAQECEALNRQRRELCDAIEAEAVALVEADGPQRPPFLLLAQGHWHHGVIGVVAARLVERYGLPVALLASEGNGRLRSSVRAPRGFAVDAALRHCHQLLERHGGHPAAGGFTVRAEKVASLHESLNALAAAWLSGQGSGIAVEPEARLSLDQINWAFWKSLQRLEPMGAGFAAPVFWSARCQVVEQRLLRGGHLQLKLSQNDTGHRAIAWRWQGEGMVPELVDVAYRLRSNHWQGEERLQLEVVGLRPSGSGEVVLRRKQRTYWCRRAGQAVKIRNEAGEEISSGEIGLGSGLNSGMEGGAERHPYLKGLFEEAALALGLAA